MTTNKTRDLVAQARSRLKERNNSGNVEVKNRDEDRFPATEIHTASGAGKEKIKRIAKEKMFASWKTYNQKTEKILDIKQICKPRHNKINNGISAHRR